MNDSKFQITNSKFTHTVLFCGGGTLGAVMPLVAVAEELEKNHPEISLYGVGDDYRTAFEMEGWFGLPFYSIKTAKAPRYFTWRWLIQPFNFLRSFIQAWKIIDKVWPDVIVNAGSFTGVPVIWAGKLLGKKIVVHQQDRLPSLSNSLTAYFANEITVAFPDQKHIFQPKIARYIGNPVRKSLLAQNQTFRNSQLTTHNSQLLIMGGSSGALTLNQKIKECLSELVKKYKVIHLTGTGKGIDFNHENYQPIDFTFDEMPRLYAEADVVISRCGLNAISELSALKKPTVFVPLPDSHQGANAQWLAQSGAVVLAQEEIAAEILIKKIGEALDNASPEWFEFYQPDAAHKLAEIIFKLAS